MNKQKILKEAQSYVGKVIKTGPFSFQFVAPYDSDELDGPSTTYNYTSYCLGLNYRKMKVVEIALKLMGIEYNHAHVHELREMGTAEMLDTYLMKMNAGKVQQFC